MSGEWVFNNRNVQKGQSFVELALAVPVMLLLLAGMVELSFYIFTYLTAVDLTREAARFASTRDYHQATGGEASLAECLDNDLDFYKDTACFFIDPNLNPFIPITSTLYSDVIITVITVANNNVTDRWPENGDPSSNEDNYWSLYADNWQKDCDGNVITTDPFYNNAQIAATFSSDPGAKKNKGFILVEVYYCYEQILGLPFLTDFLPNNLRMHAYTLMPFPEAIPTPTPIGGP